MKAKSAVLIVSIAVICGAVYMATQKTAIEKTASEPRSDAIIYSSHANDKKTEVSVNDITNTRTLQLINSQYQFEEKKLSNTPVYPAMAVSNIDIKINKHVHHSLKSLFEGVKAHGEPGMFVTSGYRSFESQTKIYNEAEDKSFVQKPGYSEHQSGLAVDLSVKSMGMNAFGNTKAGKWLVDNAWKYGFILRYPSGKEEITKISYEPWHFRYVGLPHAYYCYKNNLCLEEYIDYLKEKREYSLIIDENRYTVFYESPRRGIIEVPENGDFDVSDDNTGGYIITVTE